MAFKEIQGFGNNYLVSDEGKIWSRKTKRFLKTFVSNKGYEILGIKYKNKRHYLLVHRLVAEAFCEGYSENLQVNHIDANRLNNHASNLEWVTASKNIRESVKRGTHNSNMRGRRVKQLDLGGTLLNEFNSISEAERVSGVSRSNISAVCNAKRKKAGGFIWKFTDI